MSFRRPFSLMRFDITGGGDDDSVYLRRWSLQLIGGWTLKLHVMLRPDPDSCLHDHPWGFWTLILWGGYVERVDGGRRNTLRPGTLHYRPALYRHTIERLLLRHAVTLVLTRPRERTWGFWTRFGWRPYREFLKRPRRVLWCREEDE